MTATQSIRNFGRWENAECELCGVNFQATRTEPKTIIGPVICCCCSTHERGYKEGYEHGYKDGQKSRQEDTQ